MSDIHLNSRVIAGEGAEKSSLKQNKYLNLPDLQFFNWCNQYYRLNRGIYNTLDEWFYDYGITEILSRRIYILAFLAFVQENTQEAEQHTFIRFGNKGLSRKLAEFIATQSQNMSKNERDLYLVKEK